MKNETENTATTERLAIQFLRSHGHPDIKNVGKRQMNRMELFINETNITQFNTKAYRALMCLTQEPKLVFVSEIGAPVATRSLKVMAYRKHDKQIKTIAMSVLLRGTSEFNRTSNNLREGTFSYSCGKFLAEFLMNYQSFSVNTPITVVRTGNTQAIENGGSPIPF